jgi:pSer/pThr/pTyr-binding forkhead associated (FHA) protein
VSRRRNDTNEDDQVITRVQPPPKGAASRSSRTALPDFLKAILTVTSGPSSGRKYRLTKVRTTIGRSGEADVRIDDEGISRVHASIHFDGMEFRIRDNRSANGTLLNGSRVKEYALRSGDKLLLGESLLQFSIEETNTILG